MWKMCNIWKKEYKIGYIMQINKQKIILNAFKKVASAGYFLYITCSVFKNENEEMMAFIQKETNMELVASRLLRGYEEKADSMYMALFKRNL